MFALSPELIWISRRWPGLAWIALWCATEDCDGSAVPVHTGPRYLDNRNDRLAARR